MVGVQTGLQALGKTAFSATFGAFLTRAADFVRMGAISRADLRICGSHAGVSIGEDGPSQMAVEDLAFFRALNGSTVLYPADGNATVKLVTAMCDLERHLLPPHDARGDAAALRRRRGVPGRGLQDAAPQRRTTSPRSWAPASRVHEALKAADTLAAEGIARARDRRLLGEAGRRRRAARRARGDRD